MHVEQVPAAATVALRSQVLRGGGALPADPVDSVHLALLDEHHGLRGCASVRPEPPVVDLPGAGGPSWRLRGMAVTPALQGQGLGAQVLAAVVEHVAVGGGGLLWCNARTPARTFYARAGFAAHGDEWEDPEIGPHVVMWRHVAPARP